MEGLFESERKLQVLWKRYPGTLAATAVGEAKSRLLTGAGTMWMEDRQSLPPLFTHYARQSLIPSMSPPMGQEALTICHGLDLLLQGKPASCADLLAQRAKSLETVARGGHWSVGRQLELIRIDTGGIAEDTENLDAARRAKEEERLRSRQMADEKADKGSRLDSEQQEEFEGFTAREVDALTQRAAQAAVEETRESEGNKELFPLPTPDKGDHSIQVEQTLKALVTSLNSFYGAAVNSSPRRTALRDRIMKRLARVVEQGKLLDMVVPMISFDDFFLHRGIDYAGEEIKLARTITWEQIEASLPEAVGSLDIRDFCEGGVREYVDNFPKYLVPPEMRTIGKTPKVMCDDSEWPKVAEGLVARGLCQVMDEASLFHIDHRPLLNGLFSVSKQEYQGPLELCRLIMNLKPLNANCRPLDADTCTLPAVTQLGSCYLEEGEVLLTSSEDLRCYFYLFSVPQAWVPYMGFGKRLPPGFGGSPSKDGSARFLAARVLPMGFLKSVGIAQHIHRRVVRRCLGSIHPPVGAEMELRRDRVMSSGPRLFRIYLDNFDQLAKVDRRLAEIIQGTPSKEVEFLRGAYQEHGLPTHPKKSVEQQPGAEIQGSWLDGEGGTCMAKPTKGANVEPMAPVFSQEIPIMSAVLGAPQR
eukprot:Skav217639  [mRNA]  locus=scaffold73:30129:32516:- [translate_table: standard]